MNRIIHFYTKLNNSIKSDNFCEMGILSTIITKKLFIYIYLEIMMFCYNMNNP